MMQAGSALVQASLEHLQTAERSGTSEKIIATSARTVDIYLSIARLAQPGALACGAAGVSDEGRLKADKE